MSCTYVRHPSFLFWSHNCFWFVSDPVFRVPRKIDFLVRLDIAEESSLSSWKPNRRRLFLPIIVVYTWSIYVDTFRLFNMCSNYQLFDRSRCQQWSLNASHVTSITDDLTDWNDVIFRMNSSHDFFSWVQQLRLFASIIQLLESWKLIINRFSIDDGENEILSQAGDATLEITSPFNFSIPILYIETSCHASATKLSEVIYLARKVPPI